MKKVIIVICILFSFSGCIRESENHIQQYEKQIDKMSYQEALQETANIVNRGLPKVIDELTRCDSVSVGPGKRFTFHIMVIGYSKAEIQKLFDRSNQGTTMENSLKRSSVKSVRNNKELSFLKKNNTLIVYRYIDKAGDVVANIELNENDY